ncbi:MAG: hypothetical protein HJJLKODD_00658 [Phycisphaerae bacterium]|nr:hypothetical protein [Phycisphaerae bacterium]
MPSLPVVQDEQDIQRQVAQERERLLRQAGLQRDEVQHFRRPTERAFTKSEREQVTILLGGLTTRHEEMIHAGLEGLGYKIALVPTPVKADFQAGKEYGNNGQCNPTYFTVGALVNYLKDLRDKQGLPTEQILSNYVFLTAGACGPCRFGMYEAEYRLALRNSGFDGFRVMLFQQKGGLDQASVEAGLEMDLNFFLTILNAIFIGDLLNELAYQIRPYEVVPGQTDAVFARCMVIMQKLIRQKNYNEITGGFVAHLMAKVAPVANANDAEKFLDQLRSDYFIDGLRECLELIQSEIEVDFTRPKPIVKVTGEFWAQTTEGDGNFRMFPFLEGQGAEVLVEPVTTWILYLLNQARMYAGDSRGLVNDQPIPTWNLKQRLTHEFAYRKKMFTLELAKKIILREYNRLRDALGGTTHAQIDQLELQRMGHPYYNARSAGGEGHLEVAKNIYYTSKGYCHMVLSLKPFGCMPSTQSDGAQAAVINHFPDMIYIPIETSGEGDINAHSRVQMALGEAKAKCKEEFHQAVERSGYTLEQIRSYVARRPELRRPVQNLGHHEGIAGKAAQFILQVSEQMKKEETRVQGQVKELTGSANHG